MSQTFLEVRNLVKIFGKLTAVDDVSFKVEQGEVVTLLGPSGCGKTTTLRMVAGFEKPDAGEVEIAGRVVVATNRRINVPPERRDIGMVFQSYAIWPHMTVFENVAFPLNVRRANRQEIKRRVEETLELVGLANFSDRPAILLSGGQQQRVSLARALVYSPSILLLDEPLSNLDAKLREQMRIEIKRLQQQLGFTVLFVTHDQIEAMSLSTRLALMNQGRIEQIGTPQETYERPASAFVSQFLGKTNDLAATIDLAATPRRLTAGSWSAPAPVGLAGPVTVSIRPERIGFGDAGLAAKIVTRIFQGNHWLYQVETSNGLVTVIRQNDGAAGPAEGDAVRLAW